MNRLAPRLEVWIATGLTLIVAVMPYHAFLSVWLGSITGQEALIQSWKELVLIILAVAASIGIARSQAMRQRLMQPTVILAMLFALIAFIVTLVTRPMLDGAAYGAKTDLEFLLAFILAVVVGAALKPVRLARIIIISGVITSIIGLSLVTFLPHDLLSHFGYNISTITPFERVDPAISAIRTPSTLGGPNQFGAWLIVPFALALAYGLKRRNPWYLSAAILLIAGIFVSYSRAALIGAVLSAIVVILLSLPKRLLQPAIIVTALLTVIAVGSLALASDHTAKLGYYILHQSPKTVSTKASTSQHIISFKHGLTEIAERPLGRGLGSAGPASFHTATPFIPESYYLQIGIETGVLGLIVFLLLVARLSLDLLRRSASLEARAALAALVGLSFVSLVLHGWADSSVALIFWIFAGSLIGSDALEPTERITILGVRLDNVTFDEAVARIAAMIEQHQGGLVATVNAEFIVHAQRDASFRDTLNASALSLADGSGPTIMSRYLRTPLRARIPGVELSEALMARAAHDGWRVYLFGGFDGAGSDAANVWQERYPDLLIVGTSEPKAREIDDAHIIRSISDTKPDLILVALGGSIPRQEPWIERHLAATGATVGIGVGGTFDYVAGRRRRAPELFRRLGLEWLYRLASQPSRYKRMLALPKFVYLVIRNRSKPS